MARGPGGFSRDTRTMLKAIFNHFTGRAIAPSGMPTRSQVTEHVSPGAPYHLDDEAVPVPRWPDRGAAMVAATPESLLDTQAATIDKLRASSPLLPSEFTELVMPALLRYASWVHLLPASESHHHHGPGGLLSHGLEVAAHAARMADGKAVGVELPPSDRARFAPRWKVATMFAGLLHDLGKPLVDVGATDLERTMTWPAQAGPLYDWLLENELTHYQFYWRPGSRHERHKPVGTAVSREVLGPELLRWLSDEPTQSVVDLMMLSVAQGKTRGNLMSVIVSDADSMSVEADLRKLAEKSRATGQGATNSIASLVIAEMRSAVDDGTIEINKNGRPLWWTTEGLVGMYPAIIDEVIPRLAAKKIPGIPSSRPELAKLLCETGFAEPATGQDADGIEQVSHTWDLTMTMGHGDIQISAPALRVLRFAKPEFVLGALPLPPPREAALKSPLLGAKEKDALAMGIQVLTDAPAEPAAGDKPPAAPDHSAGAAPAASTTSGSSAEPPADAATPPSEDGPVIESRRNRGDLAPSVEAQRRRESRADARTLNDQYADLLEKIRRTGMEGEVMAAVLERIASGELLFGEDFCDTVDGLAVRFPDALKRTGVPPSDILGPFASRHWLSVEPGSDRKVCDVDYPGGHRHKSLVFTNLVGRAWNALKAEQEQVLTPRPELRRNPEPTTSSPASQAAAPPKPEAPPAQAKPAQPPQTPSPPRQSTQAPTPTPTPAAASPILSPASPGTPVGQAASAARAERPRNKADITATKAADLTPKRIEFINAAACSVLHTRGLWGTATPEQLHAEMLDFAKRNEIRLSLLPTALYDETWGLLQGPPPKKPFHELGAVAIRPGFQVPTWIEDVMKKAAGKGA